MIYLSFSIASKYNDREVPTIGQFCKELKFQAPFESIKSALTPENLRKAEFEVLGKLGFKVGEGNMQENEQIMRIHEKIISIMKAKSLTEGLNSNILTPKKVQEIALYLAS
jgi:putative NIF3 family GTP cyclohydrolase 1 type 2